MSGVLPSPNEITGVVSETGKCARNRSITPRGRSVVANMPLSICVRARAHLHRVDFVTNAGRGVASLMLGKISLASAAIIISLCASPAAVAQIDRSVAAHGGLQKWQNFASVEYDLIYERPNGEKRDHQLFDLRTRDGLITADEYTLGASKGEVWIKPRLDALGATPPRFYMWTPFYFFGMPFVFADPGAKQEPLGRKTFQGAEYDVVKITYEAGTGDSPDDFYIAYVEPASGRLKLAVYVVTYPALRKGKPMEELEQHAIVFEEWQEADGLMVPKSAAYFDWKNETTEGEALGRLRFANVQFSSTPPAAAKFTKPADAVVAPLQ